MSGFPGSSKTRNYGDFIPSTTASSLFDAAFSKPYVFLFFSTFRAWNMKFFSFNTFSEAFRVVRKRFSKFPSTGVADEPVLPSVSEGDSPQQVFSPPISLPESNSTEGNPEDRVSILVLVRLHLTIQNLEGSDSEEEQPTEFVHTFKRTTTITTTTTTSLKLTRTNSSGSQK